MEKMNELAVLKKRYAQAQRDLVDAYGRLARITAAAEVPNGEITSLQLWESAQAHAQRALGEIPARLELDTGDWTVRLRRRGVPKPDTWNGFVSLLDETSMVDFKDDSAFVGSREAAEFVARGLGVELVERS